MNRADDARAHAGDAPPPRRSALRRVVGVVWAGFQIAFWWLIAVWITAPEDRVRTFQWGALATAGVAIGIASWPAARRVVSQRLRRPARALSLVTFNLAAILLLAELGVSLLSVFVESPFLARRDARAAEQIRHHRYPPGGMHLGRACNELGFFDTPFEFARPPGTRRIVALADSFGVGVVPYEQNFLTVLEDTLGRRHPTEVLNFGVTAIGPLEYLHLWSTEAQAYDPDLVLVCFFVGNDFVGRHASSLFHPDSLRAIAVVGRLWRARSWATGQQPETRLGDPDAATFTADDYDRIERDRLQVCARDWEQRDARTLARTAANLEQLHSAIGDRLRVVVIPDEFQVDDELWHSLVDGRQAEFDREQPNRWLASQLSALAVPHLDLLPALREAQRRGRTYKLHDSHWNRLGNAVAAREIAAWLERED